VSYAVGYRFEVEGQWSEPEETLKQPERYENPRLASGKFSLNTQFTDRAGKDCGRYKVDFVTVRDPRILDDYRIDNTDIEALLRTIGSCAGR